MSAQPRVELTGFQDYDYFHPGPLFRCRTCRAVVHQDHIERHAYKLCAGAGLNWRIARLLSTSRPPPR